jgi:ceramide glucosyltransferase
VHILWLVLLLGAAAYPILSILAARRYRGVRVAQTIDCEPVSILKPVAGLDVDLELNLRTFFEQDYPAFEILFAARSADDPAVEVIERLQADYPRVPSRLIITGESAYPNAKVFSLERMLRAASHDLLVMSDSDTRVTPDLLRAIAAEFRDPKLGLATCPYRAHSGAGFWSRLEATGINTQFLSGVLVARMLEGMHFAIGPTIAARRAALDAIGGLRSLKDHLAEDFVMGKLVADAGFGVILSSCVIEHHIDQHAGVADWRENAAHRLRWARSTRRSRPAGYVGQLFTMTLPMALASLIAVPEWWAIAMLAIVLRVVSAMVVARTVVARIDWKLLPAEDLAGFGFWIAGFFGSTIEWRGRRYRIQSDGRFEPADQPVITAVSIPDEP